MSLQGLSFLSSDVSCWPVSCCLDNWQASEMSNCLSIFFQLYPSRLQLLMEALSLRRSSLGPFMVSSLILLCYSFPLDPVILHLLVSCKSPSLVCLLPSDSFPSSRRSFSVVFQRCLAFFFSRQLYFGDFFYFIQKASHLHPETKRTGLAHCCR